MIPHPATQICWLPLGNLSICIYLITIIALSILNFTPLINNHFVYEQPFWSMENSHFRGTLFQILLLNGISPIKYHPRATNQFSHYLVYIFHGHFYLLPGVSIFFKPVKLSRFPAHFFRVCEFCSVFNFFYGPKIEKNPKIFHDKRNAFYI